MAEFRTIYNSFLITKIISFDWHRILIPTHLSMLADLFQVSETKGYVPINNNHFDLFLSVLVFRGYLTPQVDQKLQSASDNKQDFTANQTSISTLNPIKFSIPNLEVTEFFKETLNLIVKGSGGIGIESMKVAISAIVKASSTGIVTNALGAPAYTPGFKQVVEENIDNYFAAYKNFISSKRLHNNEAFELSETLFLMDIVASFIDLPGQIGHSFDNKRAEGQKCADAFVVFPKFGIILELKYSPLGTNRATEAMKQILNNHYLELFKVDRYKEVKVCLIIGVSIHVLVDGKYWIHKKWQLVNVLNGKQIEAWHTLPMLTTTLSTKRTSPMTTTKDRKMK